MSEAIPLPPQELQDFIGKGAFLEMGREFLDLFVRVGGLKRHHRVLDVGCGSGRIARPLVEFLSDKGTYEGIDVWPDGIRWCRENVTTRFPNFRFQRSEVYNGMYNPDCRVPGAEYRFPFPDRSFDFVFLTSVFTHLLPADLENYLSEIRRVLRRGGRCLATFFLLTSGARERMAQRQSKLYFAYDYAPDCQVGDEKMPEAAVAYTEPFLLNLLDRHGLTTVGPVRYGRWSQPELRTNFQDVVVLRPLAPGEQWVRRVAAGLYGRLTGQQQRAA